MSGNQAGAGADPSSTAPAPPGTVGDGGSPSAPRPEAARTSPRRGRQQGIPAGPRPWLRDSGVAEPAREEALLHAPGRGGARSTGSPPFTAHRAGGAWLICPAGPVDPRALTFTAGLARDPECTVLVVDLPDGADNATLESVAQEVPPGHGSLRVVFGRTPRLGATVVARRLADRLGRTVVAAAGIPLPTPGGGLFIGSDRGPGWVRCEPGAPETLDSRGFPKPSGESVLPDRPWSLGTAVAEPLPAGAWLRPAEESAALHHHRMRLYSHLRVSSELLIVVVGLPGAAALPLADVARFWQDLPPHVRPAVRIVCYGPTRLSGGRHFGDVLAQVVGEPVRLYNGIPAGHDVNSGEVLLVGEDGLPGRPLRAHEFVHLPPTDAGGPPPPPFAVAHGWPLRDLQEIRPGTHLLAVDAVVEVVPSGLWVRLPKDPPYAAEVRAAAPDPGRERILCDADSPEALPRLRRLATELMRSFPPELRSAARMGVCHPTAPSGGRAAVTPVPRAGGLPALGGTGAQPPTRGRTGDARPHTGSGAGHEGAVSVLGAGHEGAVSILDAGHEAAVSVLDAGHEGVVSGAAEVLRQHPGLLAGRSDRDLAGLAAVLRRLAGGEMPDGPGVEAGTGGPAPSEGELLRDGLRMLPVHRGATGLRATLDDAMRRWYAEQALVVDPNVCEASVLGPRDEPGNTDFLIWSVAGRRTELLHPGRPDRVLFLPGSRFRVLRAEPEIPGVVMMREIDPGETPPTASLDRAAVRELTRAWTGWRGDAQA